MDMHSPVGAQQAPTVAAPWPPRARHREYARGIVGLEKPVAGHVDGEWLDQPGHSFAAPLVLAGNAKELSALGTATNADLERALIAAERAGKEWARVPPMSRKGYLLATAAILRRDAEPLARLIVDEVGKPILEARAEVESAAAVLDFYAGWAAWGDHGGYRQALEKGRHLLTTRHPRGVVGLVTPWNYPASNVCQKLGPALITGNTAIWRPSPLSPRTALAVTAAFVEASLPRGVLNTLLEDGSGLARALVASPAVAALSFTGSTPVGQSIAADVMKRGGAVQCEMGGKNAIVVMADADLDVAAKKIAQGAFSYSGQKCTATSRVYVHEHVAHALILRLVQEALALKVSDPHLESTDLGPVISARQAARLLAAARAAQARGAQLECGASMVSANSENDAYLVPTILSGVALNDPLLREELFGPLLCVSCVANLDEAIAQVNRSGFGLAAAIFTRDLQASLRFSAEVHCGVVKINETTPGLTPLAPMTGWGDSGLGSGELAEEGVEFFTRKKTTYLGA